MKKWLISKFFHDGRQGSGYKVCTLFSRWFFDTHIILITPKTSIPIHTDKVTEKDHFRLNIELFGRNRTFIGAHEGAEKFKAPKRFYYIFRPDIQPHLVKESLAHKPQDMIIFSLGWVKNNGKK